MLEFFVEHRLALVCGLVAVVGYGWLCAMIVQQGRTRRGRP